MQFFNQFWCTDLDSGIKVLKNRKKIPAMIWQFFWFCFTQNSAGRASKNLWKRMWIFCKIRFLTENIPDYELTFSVIWSTVPSLKTPPPLHSMARANLNDYYSCFFWIFVSKKIRKHEVLFYSMVPKIELCLIFDKNP